MNSNKGAGRQRSVRSGQQRRGGLRAAEKKDLGEACIRQDLTTSSTMKSMNVILSEDPMNVLVAKRPAVHMIAMEVYRSPRAKMVLALDCSPLGT